MATHCHYAGLMGAATGRLRGQEPLGGMARRRRSSTAAGAALHRARRHLRAPVVSLSGFRLSVRLRPGEDQKQLLRQRQLLCALRLHGLHRGHG